MFNKRHYVFVAEIINKVRKDIKGDKRAQGIDVHAIDCVIWAFAEAFKADNPAFDEDRFFNATVEGTIKRVRKAGV